MGLPDAGDNGHLLRKSWHSFQLILLVDDDLDSQAGPSSPRETQVEYSDEGLLATVTITEDFDPSATFQSLIPTRRSVSRSKSPVPATPAPLHMPVSGSKAQKIARKEKDKRKGDKERSRSMETKAERKKGREIEGRKRYKKATIAMERDGKRRGHRSTRGRRSSSKRFGKR